MKATMVLIIKLSLIFSAYILASSNDAMIEQAETLQECRAKYYDSCSDIAGFSRSDSAQTDSENDSENEDTDQYREYHDDSHP